MKEEILEIISMSWTRETCYPSLQDRWTKENSSIGQCAITALIINDFCGGKIMRCMVNGVSHYYNIVNNSIVDLTVEQFNGIIPKYELGKEKSREDLLSNKDTKSRYQKLLLDTKSNFKKHGTKEYKLINGINKEYISKVPGTLGGNKKLKIYGKLDCPSALFWIANGNYVVNRVFFASEDIAKTAGYRPCAKCMKKEYEIWKLSQ